MDYLTTLLQTKNKKILSIYFTAGYPSLHSTTETIIELQKNGVDIIEVGMPYSDPLADGPTIQRSGEKALANGMTMDILFNQLNSIKLHVKTPLVFMGYYNQLLQYGIDKFIQQLHNCNISNIIIPDLPMDIYIKKYKTLFEHKNIGISFLVTPQTSPERILLANLLSKHFFYAVAQASITGTLGSITPSQIQYFKEINCLNLSKPHLVGFGIHNAPTLQTVWQYAPGAIVGSAFIRHVNNPDTIPEDIYSFITTLKQEN